LKKIRVLVAQMPKLLSEIVGHIVVSMPDMKLVGRIVDGEDLLAAVRLTRANVLVAGQGTDDEREVYAPLLYKRPRLRIIAVAGDGATGLLYEFRPQRIALGEMSADALGKALRGQPGAITDVLPEH
jgi:hypothetical protein